MAKPLEEWTVKKNRLVVAKAKERAARVSLVIHLERPGHEIRLSSLGCYFETAGDGCLGLKPHKAGIEPA